MKIAVLGGSFNPLHIGHAMLADCVIHDLGYDKVLFVPTFIPPHKIMNKTVSDENRFEMVKRFCDSYEFDGKHPFVAEDCEIKRKGVSYTSDTLQELSEKYSSELNGEKFAFIMGEEVASQFYKWHEPEKVASFAKLLIAERNPSVNMDFDSDFSNKTSGNYVSDFSDKSYLENFPYDHEFLGNPVFPVSSTEIRARVAKGKAFRYLVPKTVYDFIIFNELYGFKDGKPEN